MELAAASIQTLFTRFLVDYPFQPATALWRAVEIASVVRQGIPRGRVLDLGCGDGRLTSIIASHLPGRQWVGVDLDPLECAQAKLTGLYSDVHVAPGNAIPEPDASFDGVFSNSVLEHISPIEPVIFEAARLLKPGAEFVFTVPYASFHNCLRGPVRPGVRREDYLSDLDSRLAHKYYFDESGWTSLLHRAGFEFVGVVPYLTRAQTRRWENISRMTAGVLYTLFGQRMRPIEIQRRLGLRKSTSRMPEWLARMLTVPLGAGVMKTVDGATPASCLFIRARRAA